MKKTTIALVAAFAVAFLAMPVAAQNVASCGWEDGTSTILGFYGALVNPTNVMTTVHSGAHALSVAESPLSSTPQALIAMVDGLTDGDTITASFWGYDTTPGASPSLRIWGHYGQSGDIGSYAGSAGGNDAYTEGTGWSQLTWTWVFDSDVNSRDAFILEARLYSVADMDTYFIDDLEVSTSSSTAVITLACGGDPVSVDGSSWGGVKALYR